MTREEKIETIVDKFEAERVGGPEEFSPDIISKYNSLYSYGNQLIELDAPHNLIHHVRAVVMRLKKKLTKI